jgi:hypothetical protein
MLTREQIIWAYRCFFGRKPESEQRIRDHSGYASWDDLRRAFINSVEFKNNLPVVSLPGRFAMAPPIQVDLGKTQKSWPRCSRM